MVLLLGEKHTLKSRGCGMYVLVLDHLQELMIILYDDMSTKKVGVEFL